MRRSSFLAGVGLTALAGGLAGCTTGFSRNGAEGDGIRLRMTTWTSNPEQLELFGEIADEFIADHPEVTDIAFESLTLDQLDMVLSTGITADDAPDLTWLPVESSLEYMEAGALLDVRPTLEDTAGYDIDDLDPDLQAPWRQGEAQYGVPFSTGPFIMYYNKELYEEAGAPSPEQLLDNDEWTWDRFREVSRSITDATGLPGYVVNDFDFRDWTRLLPVMNSFDASPWSEDAKQCTAQTDEMRDALELFTGMVFSDRSSPVPGQQVDFFGGQAGATSAFLGASSLLEDADFEWDIAPTPGGPAGDVQSVGQSAIVALSAGKHHQASLDFLAFLTNSRNAERISGYYPPARASLLNAAVLAESSGLLTPEQLGPIVTSITERGRIFPVARNGARVAHALNSSFDEFVYVPDVELEEALPRVCEAIGPVLSA